MNTSVIGSPVGKLEIQTDHEQLTKIAFITKQTPLNKPKTDFDKLICDQLIAYFDQASTKFNIEIKLTGTAFQCRVWQTLQQIDYAETKTYAQIATQLSSHARAVGNACQHNPIPIIIPCHRVVSQQGLGGYCGKTSGSELAVKHWLLEHEKTMPK